MLKHVLLILSFLFFSGTAVMAQAKVKPAKKYYDTGNALLNKGKFKESIVWFNKSLATDSSFAESYMGLGVAYTGLHQLKTANQNLTRVIRKFPKDHEAYLLRGLNYFALGDTLKALDDLNASVQSKPDFVKALQNRAVILGLIGSADLAIADMTKAIELEKNKAEYHFQRALLWENAGNYRNAMADYDTVIMINPKLYDMKAYNNRASCRKFLKDLPGCIEDYNTLLKNYPGNTVVLVNRGFAKLAMKDGEGACDDFRTAFLLGNKTAKQFQDRYCKGYYE